VPIREIRGFDKAKVRVGEGADANTRGRVCSPEFQAGTVFLLCIYPVIYRPPGDCDPPEEICPAPLGGFGSCVPIFFLFLLTLLPVGRCCRAGLGRVAGLSLPGLRIFSPSGNPGPMRSRSGYRPNHPPSTGNTMPCTYCAAGLHRNSSAPTMSSAVAQRPAGMRARMDWLRFSSARNAAVLSVAT